MFHVAVHGTDHTLVEPTRLGDARLRERVEGELEQSFTAGTLRGYVLLATCNRLEAYVEPANEASETPAALRGVPARTLAGTAAAAHLLRVAGSLESLVLGESQILGQVKRAWDASRSRGRCSSLLEELFRGAVRGAKEIRTVTGLGTMPVSVASLAVRTLVEHLRGRDAPAVAVVGAGVMAGKAAALLADQTDAEILFVNRSIERAAGLARRHGGTAERLDAFLKKPRPCDAVFVAVAADRPVLGIDHLRSLVPEHGSLRIADVCVPRAVDPRAAELRRVEVVDMDGLERISRGHAAERRRKAALAEPIVRKHVDALEARLRQKELGLDGVHRAHLELAERGVDELLARELAGADVDVEQVRRHLVGLAKAHAHLHVQDLKQRARRTAR